ncbi:MAG: hypothetical protein EHM32_03265 [Spirochaetales bacterium]|nr:MAG: hypothetical protein EHM32_03265 [Spirochaetales bacterium]
MRKPSSAILNGSARAGSAVLALALALACLSCYRYHAIRIEHRADAALLFTGKDTKPGRGRAPDEKISRSVYATKWFADVRSSSPVALINRKGIEHAFEGRFNEARNLFLEAIKEDDSMAAAYNNLGIIYEVFGRKEESFAMYSKACLLEQDNDHFKRNLPNSDAGKD